MRQVSPAVAGYSFRKAFNFLTGGCDRNSATHPRFACHQSRTQAFGAPVPGGSRFAQKSIQQMLSLDKSLNPEWKSPVYVRAMQRIQIVSTRSVAN